MARIVTLTSDFGTVDGYVGAVKGVLVSLAPDAVLVDLSHDIPAGDVVAGAWCLRTAATEYPAGTIHWAVVDPGVGSARRPVVVRAGDQLLVGPDNGFHGLLDPGKAWEIDPARVAIDSRMSQTFHGRDVFAPAAARLARGEEPGSLGREIPVSGLEPLGLSMVWSEDAGLARGRVVHVDRFGNLVTSIPAGMLARACASGGSAAGRPVGPPVACYADIPTGSASFIAGSAGLAEISVRDGSAADSLGLGPGDEVELVTGGGS
jgi:S-adenosylmethionine hydrolase